jgi:hypothetical protein
MPPLLTAALGTNLLRHGLNAFYLDGHWLEVDASLSPHINELRGYRTVHFDGQRPALLAATTHSGAPHAEYQGHLGAFADLDFPRLEALFLETYGGADTAALAELGYDV